MLTARDQIIAGSPEEGGREAEGDYEVGECGMEWVHNIRSGNQLV